MNGVMHTSPGLGQSGHYAETGNDFSYSGYTPMTDVPFAPRTKSMSTSSSSMNPSMSTSSLGFPPPPNGVNGGLPMLPGIGLGGGGSDGGKKGKAKRKTKQGGDQDGFDSDDSGGEGSTGRSAGRPYSPSTLKTRRKIRKNTREKQRRQELNDQFDKLAAILCLGQKQKAEKYNVLAETITQVLAMKEEIANLRRERQELRDDRAKLTSALQHAFPHQPDVDSIVSPATPGSHGNHVANVNVHNSGSNGGGNMNTSGSWPVTNESDALKVAASLSPMLPALVPPSTTPLKLVGAGSGSGLQAMSPVNVKSETPVFFSSGLTNPPHLVDDYSTNTGAPLLLPNSTPPTLGRSHSFSSNLSGHSGGGGSTGGGLTGSGGGAAPASAFAADAMYTDSFPRFSPIPRHDRDSRSTGAPSPTPNRHGANPAAGSGAGGGAGGAGGPITDGSGRVNMEDNIDVGYLDEFF